jgi:calcineurin-like phosphoesterase family protein
MSIDPEKAHARVSEMGQHLFSFAVITDTHFSEEDGVSSSPWPSNKLANRRAMMAFDEIAALKPAFVLHVGDMVHPVPAQSSFRVAADRYKEVASRLACEVYLTPGNHDIGDKPVDWAPAGMIQPAYIAQYEEVFGLSYYAFSSNDCRFIVLNASLFNSGLPQEAQQREWLDAEFAESAGRRTFMSIHYPPYVCTTDEPGGYDNIDEPARSWLLEAIERYKPEALFSGHVHNFWYDVHGETHFYILPASSFVRQDYSEMYRVEAGAENGRDDGAKLGFSVVDVYERGHVLSVMRSNGAEAGVAAPPPRAASTPATRLHTRMNTLPPLGVDLRHPWAEIVEIPANGGVDEFARKFARNDYPLLAIWEMGLRNLRVPLQDFVNPVTRRRMKLMRSMGSSFTTFSFGIPAEPSLVGATDLLDAIEVILPWPIDTETVSALGRLRARTGLPIFLSKLRRGHAQLGANRYAHSIQHGFLSDELADGINALDGPLAAAVDGAVIRVPRSAAVDDHIEQLANWKQRTGLRARAMVRLAGDDPAGSEKDDQANGIRVAQAAFAGILSREVEVFFDTFDDIDRGYFATNGLVDRRYNPRAAGLILRNLQIGLLEIGPDAGGMKRVRSPRGCMRLCGQSTTTTAALALPGDDTASFVPGNHASAIVVVKDLVTGQDGGVPRYSTNPSLVLWRRSG